MQVLTINLQLSLRARKLFSCAFLVIFTVSTTLCIEASKRSDGTYPYNTYVIPCAAEGVKIVLSTTLLVLERGTQNGDGPSRKILHNSFRGFPNYILPAFCYFVSNNCAFHIVEILGPSTFQITSNLKVLTTGIFMNLFLSRKLTWLQWKALVMLAIGSMVTELQNCDVSKSELVTGQSLLLGYILVIVSAVASGAGGVFSEKLLKGKVLTNKNGTCNSVSIHWQNIQLYSFGFAFGLLSLLNSSPSGASGAFSIGIFDGFNTFACATVASLAVSGLLVSFILKYIESVAKCFCAALSMVFVSVLDCITKNEVIPLSTLLGLVLTVLALEQFNLS